MSKRKLTEKQTQRIASIHQQRTETHTNESQTGTLISRYGANALVADTNWQLYTCHFRQNLPDPVPGDKLIWQQQTDHTGVITAILPRDTTLNRVTYQGACKPIAANITQMIITIAAVPTPSSELVDRYIIAAENSGFKVLILVNKCDLPEIKNLSPLINIYQNLGYPVVYVNTIEKFAMADLHQHLQFETNVFVGQSGVGKSSLIQCLLPKENLRIGEISENQQGRHTTTTTTLYRLEGDGFLVDSPGVRQFRLWHAKADEILRGYKEIVAASQHCQFRNCAHDNELSCGVKAALNNGSIDPERFSNWKKITLNP